MGVVRLHDDRFVVSPHQIRKFDTNTILRLDDRVAIASGIAAEKPDAEQGIDIRIFEYGAAA